MRWKNTTGKYKMGGLIGIRGLITINAIYGMPPGCVPRILLTAIGYLIGKKERK